MYSGVAMALEAELATFHAKLPEMVRHEGKFVLIHGDQVVDYFSTYEDAIKSGYQRFSLAPFLVKKIAAVEPVFCFTRHILPHGGVL